MGLTKSVHLYSSIRAFFELVCHIIMFKFLTLEELAMLWNKVYSHGRIANCFICFPGSCTTGPALSLKVLGYIALITNTLLTASSQLRRR